MTRVVFMFPGQGSQFPGMARELLTQNRAFRHSIEELVEALGPFGSRLRAVWLSSDESTIDVGSYSQSMLFALGRAMATAAQDSLGRSPDAVVGHSIGELAAAHHAGVFSLDQAAWIVRARADVLNSAPRGGMLAVAATEEEVAPFVEQAPAGVVVGAVNAPRQVVVCAPHQDLATIHATLRKAGFAARRIGATEPFHSPVLTDCARRFSQMISVPDQLHMTSTMVSSFAAREVSTDDATRQEFWGMQMAGKILFWEALETLDTPDSIFVEVGPGSVLSSAAAKLPSVRRGTSQVISLFPSPDSAKSVQRWSDGLSRLHQLRDASAAGTPAPLTRSTTAETGG